LKQKSAKKQRWDELLRSKLRNSTSGIETWWELHDWEKLHRWSKLRNSTSGIETERFGEGRKATDREGAS